MGDIKKPDSGSALRGDCPERVSQACLFVGEAASACTGPAVGAGEATGAAGIGAGRCAAYARVSSEQQEKDETIASQMDAIAQYAREHGFEYCREDVFLDDGYSGQLLRRPGMDKLLDSVYEGRYDRVLILSPDRLARNYGHQIMLVEELQRKGCQPVFVNRPIGCGPDEDLLLQMQGVIAQYEHAKIIERTRRGKLHRMRRGELVNGQRVFGYRYVKTDGAVPAHYEVNQEEAEVVRSIFQWYVEEGVSLRQIAARLQAQGTPTVRGGRWDGSRVGHMLGNSLYTGTGYANKIEAVEPEPDVRKGPYRKNVKSSRQQRPREEWLPFAAPEIVEQETFDLAQQCLTGNKELASRRTKRPYLLRGLIRCDCCHMNVFCDTQSNNYICALSRPAFARDRGRPACDNKRRLPVQQLDELVWREVKTMLKKPALLKKQYPQLRDKIHPRAAGSLATLDQKIDETAKQMARLNELFVGGMLSREEHLTRYKAFEQRKAGLVRQRETVAAEHLEDQEARVLLESFTTFARTIRDRLDNADFETRRGIVEQMIKSVSVGKKVITIEYVAPLKKYNLCTNLQP